MMFLVKWVLLAKLHFIHGVEMFLMPGLQEAKKELPEDSLMRKQLEMTEKKIEKEHESVLEKLD